MTNRSTKRTDADIARYQQERVRWEKARARDALEIRSEHRIGALVTFGDKPRQHPCELSGGDGGQVCTGELTVVGGYRVCAMHAAIVDRLADRASRGSLPPRRTPRAVPVVPPPRQRRFGCRTGGSTLQQAKRDADAAVCRRRSA